MLIGYARVSNAGQDLAVQQDALRAAGCKLIYSEKKSRQQATDRDVLHEAMKAARAGDIIVVSRLDCFSRSTLDVHNLLVTLEAKGVGFRCLAQAGLDTTTPTDKLTRPILGAVAGFDVDLRAKTQAQGIARAKQEGRYKGPTASIDYVKVRKLHGQGISPSEIAGPLEIGRTNVYRALST